MRSLLLGHAVELQYYIIPTLSGLLYGGSLLGHGSRVPATIPAISTRFATTYELLSILKNTWSMDIVSIGIFIVILLFSVIFHEVAHGLMAFRLGDPTAKYMGRLTLNPIPHIDLFGSIVLPALLALAGLPILGAAKPVPVNYNNLSDIRRDMFLVTIVGPLTNLVLAILAGIVYRLTPGLSEMGEYLLVQTITVNLVLAVFNMLPVPPLDGSKVLASILGYIDHNLMYRLLELERFGFFLIIIILMVPGFLASVLLPPVIFLFGLITGDTSFSFR